MRISVLLFLTACMAGCTASREFEKQSALSPNSALSTSLITIEAELRKFAESWGDTPYAEGGNSRSGIDAPGLVMVIADKILGLSLPHSTARQLGFGQEIKRSSLSPGDIVFFRPTNTPRHVGVYLGSQEFLHAWPDDGVVIANLEDPYWNGAYWAGRRMMKKQVPTTDDPPSPPRKRRVGW